MNRTGKKEEMDVNMLELFKVLWGKAGRILLAALLCGAAAFGCTKLLIAPEYKAESVLYVNSRNGTAADQAAISQSDLNTAHRLVETYTVFMQSRTTLDEVILQAKLPYDYETLKKMVSAYSMNNTEAFAVEVTSKSPKEAALIANTIANVLPEMISDFIPGSSVRIVDYAVEPNKASAPSAVKNTVLGIVLGIVGSCGVIIVKHLTDVQIHSSEYLTQTYDIPLLAVIPDLVSSGHGCSADVQEKLQKSRHTGNGGKNHGK